MAIINTNVNPYFDDFDETKNYHRILFKPGVAVQARELTQLQTMIYNQIRRFANHIFKDGTVIQKSDPSSIQLNETAVSIKLSGTPNVYAFLNLYATGSTSNIIGKVLKVYESDVPDVGDPPTIVISLKPGYENDGIFGSAETITFHTLFSSAVNKASSSLTASALSDFVYTVTGTTDIDTQIITVPSTSGIRVGDFVQNSNFVSTGIYVTEILSSTQFKVSERPGATIISSTVFMYRKATSPCLVVGVSDGVYYKKGYFIRVEPQTVVVDKYNRFPDKSILLKYTEQIITSSEDVTLLDPALGSSNYFARGADRLKVTLVADSVALNSSGTPDYNDDYIELVRYKKGEPVLLLDETQYSQIDDHISKRNYNTTGNFFLKDFVLVPYSVNTQSNFAAFSIMPGVASVGGQEVKSIAPYTLGVQKSRETKTIVSSNFSTRYGQYIIIQNPAGSVFNEDTIIGRTIFEGHNVQYPTNSSSKIYDAVFIKHIEYHGKEGSNILYKAYLYYSVPTASTNSLKIKSLVSVNNSFTNTGYIGVSDNTSNYAGPLGNALVNVQNGSDSTGNIIIYEASTPSTLIYPLAKSFVKDSTSIQVQYVKTFSNLSCSSGVVTCSVAPPESFAGGSGLTLPSSSIIQYYYAVARETASPYTAGQYINLESTTVTIDSLGTTLTVNLGNGYTGKIDLYTTIDNDSVSPRAKTLNENIAYIANLYYQNLTIVVPNSDIKAFKNIVRLGSNTYSAEYNSATTYAPNTFVKNAFNIYRSNTTTTNDALSNTLAWQAVEPLSEYLFRLDDGITESYLGFGSVEYLGANATAPGNVIIIFDHYTHTATGTASFLGPVTAASYSDYGDIPVQTLNGRTYVLRDCLDFRIVREGVGDTANLKFKTSIVPTPVIGGESDITYYLGRRDRLYVVNNEVSDLDPTEIFYLDSGLPSENPEVNIDSSDDTRQSVCVLDVPPYTRDSTSIGITYTPINRYTMKDIGEIDRKVNSLERIVNRHDIELTGLATRVYKPDGNIYLNVGIFTDDFSTTSRGDYDNKLFKAAINTVDKFVTPSFTKSLIPITVTNSTDIERKGSYITNKYSGSNIISQLGVSSYVTVNQTEAPVDTGRIVADPPVIFTFDLGK
jgi:hypothetical protein